MKNTLVLTAVLALSTLASAQQGGQTLTPEQRARIAQFQPINDLSQTVRMLPDLEKNKATAVTKTQAKSLLTLFATLQKATAIAPNDARKYLSQIEDKILTDKQLTALDGLMLKAEQERAAQRAQRQASGGQGGVRIPGVPGGIGGGFGGQGGQRPGGQGGNGANAGGQNGQGGQFDPTKFNPFKGGRGADALKAYMAVLQKK